METLIAAIATKKAELDQLRARVPGGTGNFDHSQDLELTYTSNAIEGNTLTAAETMMVIEHGITVGGKPLKDHLEAIDHFGAIGYVREIARRNTSFTEMDIRGLHRLVVLRSSPNTAGRYADQGRFVITDAGRRPFPSPVEIPSLMHDFVQWLQGEQATPGTAFTAHRRLVDIHPFNDGNGRTGRLLMNLVLIRGGYPPVAIRPQDRAAYISALQQAQAGEGAVAVDRLLYQRLDATLTEYVSAVTMAALISQAFDLLLRSTARYHHPPSGVSRVSATETSLMPLRPFAAGSQPLLDSPIYGSTAKRHPNHALVRLPLGQTVTETTAPRFNPERYPARCRPYLWQGRAGRAHHRRGPGAGRGRASPARRHDRNLAGQRRRAIRPRA